MRFSAGLLILLPCKRDGVKIIHIDKQGDFVGPKARERFNCHRENGCYVVPSNNVIRDVLIRVDPAELDRALQRWNQAHGGENDQALAIDGKTMCNAIDIKGKDITADALLTQRNFDALVKNRISDGFVKNSQARRANPEK